jgi:hypothetical protein
MWRCAVICSRNSAASAQAAQRSGALGPGFFPLRALLRLALAQILAHLLGKAGGARRLVGAGPRRVLGSFWRVRGARHGASIHLQGPAGLWHLARAFTSRRSSGVEHTLGKGGVVSSILTGGTSTWLGMAQRGRPRKDPRAASVRLCEESPLHSQSTRSQSTRFTPRAHAPLPEHTLHSQSTMVGVAFRRRHSCSSPSGGKRPARSPRLSPVEANFSRLRRRLPFSIGSSSRRARLAYPGPG